MLISIFRIIETHVHSETVISASNQNQWILRDLPIRPMTEINKRKTPLAVIPPTIGILVTMPETLPE